MRLAYCAGSFLLAVSMGSATARAADPAPLSVLKEKGLAKSGTTYVIEEEKPVLEKIKEVKAIHSGYAQIAGRQAMREEVTATLSQLDQQHAALQEQLTEINQQITIQAGGGGAQRGPQGASQLTPMIAQRDQIKFTLAEVSMEQKALKDRVPKVKDESALDDEVKKKGEALKAALAELRPMVDSVTKKYAELQADPSIKKARNDLQKATKANIKLGPSDAFKSGVKYLDQAERQVLGKKPAPAANKKAKAKTKTRK